MSQSSITCHLLDLPVELLVQEILLTLEFLSLLRLRRTCRSLRNVIDYDPHINYLMELQVAGMRDNRHCSYNDYPIKKRLEMLKEYEDRWRKLMPKWSRTISFPISFRSSYHTDDNGLMIFGGKYVQWKNGEAFTSDALSFHLPADKDSQPSWEEFNFDEPIELSGFGSAPRTCDLCVFVTKTPGSGRLSSGTLKLHLIQYTTFRPHPMAMCPIITLNYDKSVEALPDSWTVVSVDVCGPILTLLTAYIPVEDDSRFLAVGYMWDWRTGQELSCFELPMGKFILDPIWLVDTQDLFLWPNERYNILEIYRLVFPETPGGSFDELKKHTRVELVLSLALPQLKPEILTFITDLGGYPAVPPPPLYPRKTSIPWHNPSETVMFLTIEYISKDCIDEDDTYDPNDASYYSLFMYQSDIIYFATKAAERSIKAGAARFAEYLPWEKWGPQASRWIPCHSEVWTSTCDQRACRLVKSIMDGNPKRWMQAIEIFDFAPLRVAQMAYADCQSRQNGTAMTEKEFTDCYRVHDYKGEFNPPPGIIYRGRDEPTIITPENSPFERKVASHMPYSRRYYDWRQPNSLMHDEDNTWGCAGISLDEHRIIGIMEHNSMLNHVDAFNVLYFG